MSESEQPLSQGELGKLRHDLRTPFNGLRGYAELLRELAADDGLDGFSTEIGPIEEQVRVLLDVVEKELASGRTVRPSELRSLADTLAPPGQVLAGRVRVLLDRAPTEFASLERDLTRLHGAALELLRLTEELRSVEGEKSSAEMVVPVPVIPTESPVGWQPPRCVGGKVLVVDDNETNRDLLCRRLHREGYESATASGGLEALARLSEGGLDLVLLDILMPDMDGYEVLRRIKGEPAWRDLPVIMISAVDDLASVVRCIEMGAEDYLPKPFDPVLLRARVGACLEKKRLRDAELEYLRGVEAVQEAASAVESGTFDGASLTTVAQREDALGRLARVFQRMANEIKEREQRLKSEVRQLKIEIDMVRKTQQVKEITDDPFFGALRNQAETLRARRRGEKP